MFPAAFQLRASHPASYNIHYHIDVNPVYLVSQTKSLQTDTTFISPQKHIYCVMWVNPQNEIMRLSYEIMVQPTPAKETGTGMPVRIVSSYERKAVRFLDMSGRELARLNFHSEIFNFTLSPDQNRLAVLPSDIKETIRVFRLQEMLPPYPFQLPRAARFVAFTGNGSSLAVADKYEAEVMIFDLGLQKTATLKLPALLLALET